MGARAQSLFTTNNRRPPGQAPTSETSTSRGIPAEYSAVGWEAFPRTVRHLYGGRMPSRYAWLLLIHLNRLQLEHYREGADYGDLPGDEWSDGRQHAVATPARSITELADDLGCSPRTIDYGLSDMVQRGILARRKGVKLGQFALRIDQWDKVTDPEAESGKDAEADSSQAVADPPAGKVSGAARVELPHLPVSLTSQAAKKYELSYTVVAGELKIDVEVLGSSVGNDGRAKDATGCVLGASEPGSLETPNDAMNCVIGAPKSFIPFKTVSASLPSGTPETRLSTAPANYAAEAQLPTREHWRTAVQNLVITHCKTTAGPQLIAAIEATCNRGLIKPAELIEYCNGLAGARRGRESLVKYGPKLFERWASDLAVIRHEARENPSIPCTDADDAELRYRQRRWMDADDELRAELAQLDPASYPPVGVL